VRDDEFVAYEVPGATPEERDAILRGTAGSTTGTFADPMAMSFEQHRRQLEDFLAAIEEDRAPLVDGREGLKSVEVVEAIYASVRSGAPVGLDCPD
jgi:UDP-N-acetyl-2-amino-2-deoxyglucuronate dehydrogenase